MKKIILTVTNDLSYDQRMLRICTTLSERYEVLLLGRRLPESIPLRNEPFKQKRLKCVFNKGALFYAEYNIRVFLFLILKKYNAHCSIDLDTLLSGYLLTTVRPKLPLVYDAHEYFTEVPELVERPKIKAIWEQLAKRIIPRIKHAYTVCESLAELFKKNYGTPFEVIRNVPFIEATTPPYPKQQPPIILYQGALNDGRGLEEMIDLMQYIEKAELWLAGEGDLSQELRQLVTEAGLESKVKFLGFVPPHELKALTHKATIGINLLQNKGLNYYYSLANKSFDYIQAGVPAINMDFPEYQKITAQYEVALLAPDLSKDTLLPLLKKLLENKDYYENLVKNCLEARLRYNWEVEKRRLLKIWEGVLPL